MMPRMMLRTNGRAGLGVALAAVIILLSGCSSSVTRTDGRKASVFLPSAEVPIGVVKVATTDKVREKLKDSIKFSPEQLRGAIEQALKSNQMFASQSGEGVSMDVLVTHIRVRSTFNAVMWGAMAGNDALEGDVTITDASGKVIDKFAISTSYALGGLAGGQDAARVGWLYEAFAKQVIGQFTPEAVADLKQKIKK